jgi:chromosome segregation protein
MRLSTIKLAGFKSFVDPTTISFPSNLVGVVGPNGCGKSNVIDAVRWVMGESSASRLRGDSITDVIFNGSSTRKPIGAASVELLFDNSNTTLEGQYAKYAEIGIRREVSRDGISTYYLNGTKCRRKDITGVFLGTGLGSRSYSIIEQGMISRLIEAKPEEMRVFLEEAAGISKYKERRRETSNRIKRTRENLDRLMDVLEEVEQQIKRLDRQAKMAVRYGRLKDGERRTAAELLALRLRVLDQCANETQRELTQKETTLEAQIAQQRKIETDIEQLRVSENERSDDVNEVQARFYKSGSEIARLEQTIEHAYELRERQQKDLELASQGAKEIVRHINQDKSEIEQLEFSLSKLVPGLEQAKESENKSIESLEQAEKALADWQLQWDDYVLRSNEAQQIRNIEQMRMEEIESRINSFVERNRKLVEAENIDNLHDLQKIFETLSKQDVRKRQAIKKFDRDIVDIGGGIRELREQELKLNKLVDERHVILQNTQAKYTSLAAMQKVALGQSDESIQSWLEAIGLDKNPRVAQSLDVESEWERAVETVLGAYLQAVCVPNVTTATANLSQLQAGNVTLLMDQSSSEPSSNESVMLISKVNEAPAAVVDILKTVRIADSLEMALAIRKKLQCHESVITSDGVWLSEYWLRVSRNKNAKAGVLSREHDMRRLKTEIREAKRRSDSTIKLLKEGRVRLMQLEEHREKTQCDATSLLNDYSEFKANLDSARYRLDQANSRQAAIAQERVDIEKEQVFAEKQVRKSRSRFSQAIDILTELEANRETLELQREELRTELKRVRAQSDQDRQTTQAMIIQFESRRSTKESAAQNLARMQSQLQQFRSRETEIRGQLEQNESPLGDSKTELDKELKIRITVEEGLAEVRRQLEDVEHSLRELDRERMQAEHSVDGVRGEVNESRMAFQEIRVRREGFMDQLAQTEFDLDPLLDYLSEDAEIESWKEKLEKIRDKIERLGLINLAAIDEFKEQSERKEYLDLQLKDLNGALATLDSAIRKIDRETRTRFRETFTNVDKGFKRLFPKLFGGGHAYLELTGEDLLSAGVTVMARPPGKRNSTIHLLSGGEKALTAVALVFAIFELNPAPFCLLDEVDAPLDDANVYRFCKIVKDMAQKVQFVLITHNKGTMEMTRQLIGVTMQEPGVSRLVAVDLDEAINMAAS